MLSKKNFFQALNWFLLGLLFSGILISLILNSEVNGFHFVGIFFVYLSFLLIWFSSNILYSKSTKIPVLQIFAFSLIIRIIFVYIVAEIFIYTHGFPFITYKDDFVYNDIAQKIAKNWQTLGINFSSGIPMSTGFYSGYPNFSAYLMYLFGTDWWIPRIGNAILGAWTVVYFAKIVYRIYPKTAANIGIVLMMFSPVFITYSSLQLKDTLLIFLISGAIYYIVLCLDDSWNLKNGALIILFMTGLIFVRAATIPPIFIAALFSFFSRDNYKILGLTRVFGSVLILGIIVGVIFLWNYLGQMDLIETPEFYFGSRYESLVGAGSGSDNKTLISGTNLAFLFSTPLFIAGSIILPIPLVIHLSDIEFFTNYTYTANIFLMGLTPFFTVALYNWFKNREKHRIILMFVIIYFLYKIGQAFSLSVFDIRQSLPGIFCMYVIIPMFFCYKGNKKIMYTFYVLGILALVAYAYARLSSRNLV